MSDRAARLGALLADHAAAVDEFFHRAAQVTSGRWNTPRAEGKWSPAQEVKHVILAYEAFTNDLTGAARMRLVGTPFKRMLWRAIGLTMILWGRRIPPRARAPRESRPAEGDHEQQALLNEFRERTTAFDAIFRKTWQDDPAKRVVHPYFGELDLVDAIRMCTVHTRHHAAVLPPPGARQQIGA
jgi:uncharacterized damage-inducible protein DinB